MLSELIALAPNSARSTQHSGARLRALGLRPKKRLSQSFLEDPRVAEAIIRAATVSHAEDVLEVGPGLGVLTERLAHAARRVVAIELDPDLAQALRENLTDRGHVEIVTADVLKVDPATFFDQPYVVVANLPYHITSPALRHLLSAGPPAAKRLVVMVQAEVAERIAGRPGEMSALAVTIQSQAAVKQLAQVPAAAFFPRPKVESAVLLLEPLTEAEKPVQKADLARFMQLVHAGFKQPRKTLANSLAEGLCVSKQEAQDLLGRANLDPTLRPQALAVADWVRLFEEAS